MTDDPTTTRHDAARDGRLGRRSVLGTAAATAVAGLATRLRAPTPVGAQAATPTGGGQATFVLVPGAWAGAVMALSKSF